MYHIKFYIYLSYLREWNRVVDSFVKWATENLELFVQIMSYIIIIFRILRGYCWKKGIYSVGVGSLSCCFHCYFPK